jgi:hypothetical protein
MQGTQSQQVYERPAVIIKNHDSEFHELAEVMQHAARKVAVMQQLVDASTARLEDEMELSRCLKVASHFSFLNKVFIACMLCSCHVCNAPAG